MYESEIESFRAEVMQLNDYIADNPETGSEEFKASKAIVTLLRKHGIDVEFPFNDMDTAFRGTINRGKSKKFAILAEYDALRGLGHAGATVQAAAYLFLQPLYLTSSETA